MFKRRKKIVLNEYDTFLFNIVQNLDKYPSKKGTEGVAYFVDDKFVVKEYAKKNYVMGEEVFDAMFQCFFDEMQFFANQGFSTPKFYAWLKIPNTNKQKDRNQSHEMNYKYYILQERVPGRNLYYNIDKISEVYELVSHLCSYTDFVEMSEDLYCGDDSLRVEILKTYIADYIMVNEMLESMPESELENFLVSGYEMLLNGKYSRPDIYRGNILIDSSKLSIIDNRMQSDSGSADLCVEKLLKDILLMLETNNSARNSLFMKPVDFDSNKELEELDVKNKRLCAEVLKKMMKIFKNRLNMKHVGKYTMNKVYLSRLLHDEAESIIAMIEK